MTSILGISAYYHDSAAALVVDGTIVAAAQEAGCRTVFSEDLNAGQDYDGVRVVNPFYGPAS